MPGIPSPKVIGGGLLVLLVVAALYDYRISTTLSHWPDADRAFFGWLTRWGESDWILVPALLVWVLGYLCSLFPVGYTNKLAARGLSGMAGYVFVSVGLIGLLSNLLKRLIGRARPVHLQSDGVLSFHPLHAWDYQSFPSGHATTSVAFAVALYVLFGKKGLFFVPIAVLICVSRIVEGMHFFTDVIGGVFLGYFGAWAVTRFYVARGWGLSWRAGHVHDGFAVPLRRRLAVFSSARRDNCAGST